MNMLDTFRNDLAARMLEENLSQQKISRLSGLDQASLSRFLRGETGISGKNVFALWPFVYGDLPTPRCSASASSPNPSTGGGSRQ